MTNIKNLVDESKVKRVFRARRKICYPQACCHITQRAPGRELLFLEESDYLYMLHLLKEKSRKFNFDFYAFSLLPNHYHLQLQLRYANLSVAMKSIAEEYAMEFNRKYHRKGHVFGGPYRQALCLDETYLLATSLYIHLNPVRAGLAKNPQDYRWSSCRLYVENMDKETFINYAFVLKTLCPDIAEARKTYRKLINQAASVRAEEIWHQPKAVENFRRQLFSFIRPILKKSNKDIFEEDIEAKIKEIKENKYQRGILNIQTRLYLIQQLRASGYNMEEISGKLNLSRRVLYDTLKLHKTGMT